MKSKPIHRTFDSHRKTSMLFFKDEPAIECYIKAGICFPMTYDSGVGIQNSGFAVMGAQDIRTKYIYVFEQMEWVTIDDIIAEDNTIRYRGLSHFFNQIWTEYFGEAYYFNQPDELSRRFRLQILRSKMVNPKPRFVEVPIQSQDDLLNIIWYQTKKQGMEIDKTSKLATALTEMQKNDKNLWPATYALGCMLMAFERFPWREPSFQTIREVLVPSDRSSVSVVN